MKTHTIKTPTAELLIVELPEGFQPTEDDENYYISLIDDDYTLLKIYSKGSYTLLGKRDEIREEDAKELVNLHESGYYKDYINGNNFFTLPSKSLLSAIEREIFWENPIPPFAKQGEDISVTYTKWHEAQEKTFDRSRSIILVKQ